MKLAPGQALSVLLHDGQRVGRLAWRDRTAWFEYDEAFLSAGLELSPFHLPLRPGVLRAPPRPFGGLFGLFDDSLPDGWGLLLQDRLASQLGVNPATLTPLDRLGQVGRTAIGALAYEPELIEPLAPGPVDLDALASASTHILEGAADDVLPELLRLGGSPHGARPKVLVWLRPADHHVTSGGLTRPAVALGDADGDGLSDVWTHDVCLFLAPLAPSGDTPVGCADDGTHDNTAYAGLVSADMDGYGYGDAVEGDGTGARILLGPLAGTSSLAAATWMHLLDDDAGSVAVVPGAAAAEVWIAASDAMWAVDAATGSFDRGSATALLPIPSGDAPALLGGDFDGDGSGDLAAGDPYQAWDTARSSGVITLSWGP